MKKYLLLMVMVLALALTACNSGSSSSSGGAPSVSAPTVIDPLDDAEVNANLKDIPGVDKVVAFDPTGGKPDASKAEIAAVVSPGLANIDGLPSPEGNVTVTDADLAAIAEVITGGKNGEGILAKLPSGAVVLSADVDSDDDDKNTGGFVVLTKTSAGFQAVYSTGSAESEGLNVKSTFKNEDFKAQAGDYLVAVQTNKVPVVPDKFKGEDGSGFTSGTLTTTSTFFLGGQPSDLQFSEFGGWAVEYKLNGTYTEEGKDHTVENESWLEGFQPLAYGDANKGTNFDNFTGTRTFTGKTIAEAKIEDAHDATSMLVTGTAELDINSGSGIGDFRLKFPGFADLKLSSGANSDIDDHGAFSKQYKQITISNANSDNAVDFKNGTYYSSKDLGLYVSSHTAVTGNFYGDKQGTPTEAAGTYDIALHSTEQDAPEYSLNGAFGLKGGK